MVINLSKDAEGMVWHIAVVRSTGVLEMGELGLSHIEATIPPACRSQGLAAYSEKRQAFQHLRESNLSASAILMTSAVSPKEWVFSCQQEPKDKTFGKESNTSFMMDNSGKDTQREHDWSSYWKNSFQLKV